MARLEHLGIAVEDVDAVVALYEALLDVRPYRRETVAREGVRTHFLAAGSVKLELLEALGPESPVARSLAKRGEGLHHAAFEVDDVDAAFERVRRLGYEPLGDAPRPGADGKRIFFLHPRQTHGVLVEFCQSTRAPLEPVWIDGPHGRLAVHRGGAPEQTPVVLLVDGRPDLSEACTAALFRRLEPHHHLLALDLSPHDRPPASLAEDVLAAMDHADLPAAHFVGVEAGGRVALEVARRRADRVIRLALHELPAADAPDASDVPHPVLVSSGDAEEPLTRALALRRRLPAGSLAVLPGAALPLRDADFDLLVRLVTAHFA